MSVHKSIVLFCKKISTHAGKKNNDRGGNNTSEKKILLGFLNFLFKLRKKSFGIYIKGNGGISILWIHLDHIILQSVHSRYGRMADEEVHKNTGDNHQ